MTTPSRDALYLDHIAERIQRIDEIAPEGRDAFESSHVLQNAIIRNFEVIGEAVKQLSPELLDPYPHVPWRRVAGFRDVLIHNYMGVDRKKYGVSSRRTFPFSDKPSARCGRRSVMTTIDGVLL